MVATNWEHLPKNQTDPETIEEAITRIVQEHDDDPEAHLDAGQSLEAHKNSDVIDHLADSIINDKIKDNQISPSQLSFGNKFVFLGITTLDSFDVSAVGSSALAELSGFGRAHLVGGDTIGNKTTCHLNPGYIDMIDTDDPIFECRIEDIGDSTSDVAVAIGIDDAFATSHRIIGFIYKLSTDKIYSFYRYGPIGATTLVEHEIGSSYFSGKIYRIEVDSTAKTITWFVDGVVVWTVDYTGKTILNNGSNLFTFSIKRAGDDGNSEANFWNVFFTKKGTN